MNENILRNETNIEKKVLRRKAESSIKYCASNSDRKKKICKIYFETIRILFKKMKC